MPPQSPKKLRATPEPPPVRTLFASTFYSDAEDVEAFYNLAKDAAPKGAFLDATKAGDNDEVKRLTNEAMAAFGPDGGPHQLLVQRDCNGLHSEDIMDDGFDYNIALCTPLDDEDCDPIFESLSMITNIYEVMVRGDGEAMADFVARVFANFD